MRPTHYLAIAIALVAIGGLVAVNIGDSPEEAVAVDASADDSDRTDSSDTEPSTTEPAAPEPSTAAPSAAELLTDAPPDLGPAGDLVELDGWLQTDATRFSDFDGTVRVVQFWTFGCVNCRNTLENLRALYDRYEPLGLEVIGVHAPEFDFEADPAAIAEAAVDLGVSWPIALDTEKTNFRAWQPGRRFWPRTFVVDRDGNIRFDRIGEGAYDELNSTVAWLIENEEA